MGQVYPEITDRLAAFIAEQPMFFVATAPSGDSGHVNVSPKGMSGTFKVLDAHTVAYLDWGGSGIEGTAHMRQNGRVCVMFCSFGRSPKILRLHGTGTPVLRGDARFDELAAHFESAPDLKAVRGIITVDVTRVADSCGYGVPYMELKADRMMLVDVNERRDAATMAKRRLASNTVSLDGLPGVAGTPAEKRYHRMLATEEPAG